MTAANLVVTAEYEAVKVPTERHGLNLCCPEGFSDIHEYIGTGMLFHGVTSSIFGLLELRMQCLCLYELHDPFAASGIVSKVSCVQQPDDSFGSLILEEVVSTCATTLGSRTLVSIACISMLFQMQYWR